MFLYLCTFDTIKFPLPIWVKFFGSEDFQWKYYQNLDFHIPEINFTRWVHLLLDIYFIHELLYSFPLDLSLFFKKWFLYYYHGYRFYWILIVYVSGSYILDLALLRSFLKGMYSCTGSLVIITTLVLLIIIPWPHLFVTTIESFVLNFCLFWSIHDLDFSYNREDARCH